MWAWFRVVLCLISPAWFCLISINEICVVRYCRANLSEGETDQSRLQYCRFSWGERWIIVPNSPCVLLWRSPQESTLFLDWIRLPLCSLLQLNDMPFSSPQHTGVNHALDCFPPAPLRGILVCHSPLIRESVGCFYFPHPATVSSCWCDPASPQFDGTVINLWSQYCISSILPGISK